MFERKREFSFSYGRNLISELGAARKEICRPCPCQAESIVRITRSDLLVIPNLDRHVRCRHWHHHLVHHVDFRLRICSKKIIDVQTDIRTLITNNSPRPDRAPDQS